MLTTTFPEWLPPSVAREAQRILDTECANVELVMRLATDERMEGVWRELARHKNDRPVSAFATFMADRVDVPPPENGDPLALFFWIAYTFATLKPAVGRVSTLDLPIAEYRLVAAALRAQAAKLWGLNHECGEVIENAGQFTDIHRRGIEDAAAFCDEVIETLSQQRQVLEAPLVVGRIHGQREARGYILMLAVETRGLFGQLLAGTVARVASVALQTAVTEKQVRNWCPSQ